jgi:hypothetical protein
MQQLAQNSSPFPQALCPKCVVLILCLAAAGAAMSFWVVVPSFTLRATPNGDVCLFAVEVGVQALNGEKTRRTVARRFSDFIALAARLRKELGPEKLLPTEPPKHRLQRVDDAFLQERRRALESWLWALLGDVEVAHTHALTTFLELAAARKGALRWQRMPPGVPVHQLTGTLLM